MNVNINSNPNYTLKAVGIFVFSCHLLVEMYTYSIRKTNKQTGKDWNINQSKELPLKFYSDLILRCLFQPRQMWLQTS